MADATALPTGLAIWLAVGTPVLTFAAVLLANLLSRRTAREAETRSRREETMRNLRWAAELSLDDNPKRALLGVKELEALATAEMLDAEQKVFVTAAHEAVVAEAESAIDELFEEGQEVIVEVSGSASGQTTWIGTAEAVRPGVDSGAENGGDDG